MAGRTGQQGRHYVDDSILQKAVVCRLALAVNDSPYIVPVNFGYDGQAIYFHSAREGQKIDMLKANNRVCIQADADYDLVKTNRACTWSFKYRSVIGYGRAYIIDDPESKKKALDIIMAHYAEGKFEYVAAEVEKMIVVKIEIDSLTGKQSGY